MEGTQKRVASNPLPPQADARLVNTVRVVVIAAWLGVVLGIVMQVTAFVLQRGLVGVPSDGATVVADLAQKITWSSLVCAAIGFGTIVSRGHAFVSGLVGLLAAPAAFHVARAAQKMVQDGLEAAALSTNDLSPSLLACLRGVEYAVLGMGLAWVKRRGFGLVPHGAVGLATGLGVAAGIAWMLLGRSPMPPPAGVIARVVQEILSPVGCALVVYASVALASRIKAVVPE